MPPDHQLSWNGDFLGWNPAQRSSFQHSMVSSASSALCVNGAENAVGFWLLHLFTVANVWVSFLDACKGEAWFAEDMFLYLGPVSSWCHRTLKIRAYRFCSGLLGRRREFWSAPARASVSSSFALCWLEVCAHGRLSISSVDRTLICNETMPQILLKIVQYSD